MDKTHHRTRFAAHAGSGARPNLGTPVAPRHEPMGAFATASPGPSRAATARRGPVHQGLSEKHAILPNEPIWKNNQRSINKRLKAGFGGPESTLKQTQTNRNQVVYFLNTVTFVAPPSFRCPRFSVPPGARSEHSLPGAATEEATLLPTRRNKERATKPAGKWPSQNDQSYFCTVP